MSLTDRQEAAALLLGEFRSRSTVCHIIRIGGETLKKWEADPEFSSKVKECRQAYLDMHRGSLLRLVPKAIKQKEKLLNAQSEAVRNQAATDVLKMSGFMDAIEKAASQSQENSLDSLVNAIKETRERISSTPEQS